MFGNTVRVMDHGHLIGQEPIKAELLSEVGPSVDFNYPIFLSILNSNTYKSPENTITLKNSSRNKKYLGIFMVKS